MPDFEDIKKEAESHPQDVDKGVDKLEQFADKEAGGKGEGLIDKAGDEAKRVLGVDQQGRNQ